jgi:hypothetical protein
MEALNAREVSGCSERFFGLGAGMFDERRGGSERAQSIEFRRKVRVSEVGAEHRERGTIGLVIKV